ncbi:glycosyltransferase [Vibrio harveyi]|uniref:glycosyltransferase n=1 Tax=Vibrio harveyi TaxID=669 RepID=UPI004067D256
MKILLITDSCLTSEYNAGVKNAFLNQLDCYQNFLSVKVDILHFHHKKSDINEVLNTNEYIWAPDWVNLVKRKIKGNNTGKLLEYKISKFRKKVTSNITRKKQYDYIVICYIENSYLIESIDRAKAKVICDINDIMSFRRLSFLENGELPKDENLNIDLDEELSAMAKFDAILAIEESEFKFLKKSLNNEVILLKRFPEINNVKIRTKRNDIESMAIGFIGGGAQFNVDSINYFIENIWNKDLHNDPKLNLYIAGSVCEKINITPLGNSKVLGVIDDVFKFYQLVDISINPILYGSGLKMKNVESLLYGIPVITNKLGAKGFEFINDNFMRITDTSDIACFKRELDIMRGLINSDNYNQRCRDEAMQYFSKEVCSRDLRAYMKC